MAEIPVPIDFLVKKLNIAAIRNITGKVEKTEVKPFEVDTNIVLESRQRRKPMNINKTKMPKAFFENMVPITNNDQTDRIWTSSDNGNSNNSHSNGLSKSILSSSEEREPLQSDFDRMRQINERLSNKSFPTSTPINQNNNGFGQISEDRVRELIREEVYRVLGDIVKQEGENRLIKEEIQIRIGSSIFSGNLTPIQTKVKNNR